MGQRPVLAHSFEKLTFANAEIAVPNPARAPFPVRLCAVAAGRKAS